MIMMGRAENFPMCDVKLLVADDSTV